MPALAASDPTRRLDLLRSPAAHELLAALGNQPPSAADELRLSKQLRAEHPPELVAAVLGLLELRSRGAAKFERAASMFFTRAGLEQASAEATARWRAARFAAFERVGDLCCGIGGDLIALAAHAEVVAVDVDPVHLEMADLNASVYGHPGVECVAVDVRAIELGGVAAAFVDPARRRGDRRLAAGASDPPLAWCFAQTLPLAVKAAPGLSLDLVPDGWEVEFVADGRELKECVLWSPALRTVARRATVLPDGLSLEPIPGASVAIAPPGGYVVDPSAAVTRAGLVEDLARTLGAWKIDDQVAFLSSDEPLQTPFGRTLCVESSLPWNLKRLRARLRELDVGIVDIRKRGSPVDVDDLQRRLKLDGHRAATILLTRVQDRPWAMICTSG